MSAEALLRAIQIAGNQARFAEAIGVKPQAIKPYFTRGLSPERCPAAEAATGVTCEQLRPDLRWQRDADNRVIAYAVPLEPVELGKAVALEPAA
jgi:DNA-binding transcriptional regulator YdaS (Cro superfamily)